MMKTALVFYFVLLVCAVTAQQPNVYYFGVNGKIETTNSQHTRVEIELRKHDRLNVVTYYCDEHKWKKVDSETWRKLDENRYIISSRKGKNTTIITRTYYDLGDSTWQFIDTWRRKMIRRGITTNKIPLMLDGMVTSYYLNGGVSSESVYQKNELKSNKNWLESGIEYYDNLFYSVDRYPAFSRGNDQLNDYLFKKLKDNQLDFSRISGQMVIGFVVFEDGKIGGFRVLKGISPHLEQLVVDALRDIDGDWIPAKLNGENVKFFQTFPINFSHDEFQLEFFDLSSGIAQFERK